MTVRKWVGHLIAATFVLVFISPMAWLLLDRDSPIVVHASGAVTPEVQAGANLRVYYTITVNRICRSTSYPIIFDETGLRHAFLPETFPAATGIGSGTAQIERTIPLAATPGEARYRLSIEWECPYNLFHKIWPVTQTLPDVNFTITPAYNGFNG